MYADLHVHSHYSDGTDSPAALVNIAKNLGVSVLSMTDHDSVRGVCEFLREAKKSEIEAVPGVEISTSRNGASIHILGYFIDAENVNLQKYLGGVAKARTENTKFIFDKLCEMGTLNFSWGKVLHYSRNKDGVSSADVFAAMKNDKIYSSWREFPQFYYSYFGKNSAAYVNFDCFLADGAIKAILAAGGIPVLAHPKLMGDDSQINNLIEEGLMGIEVYHPAHDQADMQRYLDMATSYGLLITGGSDWHGEMSVYEYTIGECGINQALVDRLWETRTITREEGR